VWVDDEWRWFDVKEDTGRLIAVPEEAWTGDILTVRRLTGDFNPNVSFLALKKITEATETIDLGPPGEQRERRNRFEDDFFEGPDGLVEVKRETVPVELAENLTEPAEVEIIREGFIEGDGFDAWVIQLAEGDEIDIEPREQTDG